jgi:hypothetical protein
MSLELKGAMFSALAAFCKAHPELNYAAQCGYSYSWKGSKFSMYGGSGIAKKGVQAELELERK